MDSIVKKFRVKEGEQVSLKKFDPGFSEGVDKDDAARTLVSLKEEMAGLQDQLYATADHSLLLIFQAMDAAGKDSVIKHVMSGLNPQGCEVFSFKQPSPEESSHDFLWRHVKALPEKGRIGIHNRSHYENVLVCKVHPEILTNEGDADGTFWKHRVESIRDFEKHLSRNHTVILKFFLNVSKDEQKERFLERLADPEKNWKFAAGDLEERKRWDDYMAAYEFALSETSTDHAPWFVIPADKKWFTRIAVAQIIVETLKALKMEEKITRGLLPQEVKKFTQALSND